MHYKPIPSLTNLKIVQVEKSLIFNPARLNKSVIIIKTFALAC